MRAGYPAFVASCKANFKAFGVVAPPLWKLNTANLKKVFEGFRMFWVPGTRHICAPGYAGYPAFFASGA